MKFLSFGFLLGLLATFSACSTSSSFETERAMAAQAQQRAFVQAQPSQPTVMVRGEVKFPIIPWTEELTLAKAILAAEYHGDRDPRFILITRQGQTHRINPKHLLNGFIEDPPLEPGDLIELWR